MSIRSMCLLSICLRSIIGPSVSRSLIEATKEATKVEPDRDHLLVPHSRAIRRQVLLLKWCRRPAIGEPPSY